MPRAGNPPRSHRAALAAVVLLIAGLAFGALCRFAATGDQHAYFAGNVPPQYSTVSEGQSYRLSVPGGTDALTALGVPAAKISCEYATPGGGSSALTMSAEPEGTKATNVFGSFTAPLSGQIGVTCWGYGAAFIDDADDAPADVAGWYLVLCVACLSVGGGLALSVLRRMGRPHPPGATA